MLYWHVGPVHKWLRAQHLASSRCGEDEFDHDELGAGQWALDKQPQGWRAPCETNKHDARVSWGMAVSSLASEGWWSMASSARVRQARSSTSRRARWQLGCNGSSWRRPSFPARDRPLIGRCSNQLNYNPCGVYAYLFLNKTLRRFVHLTLRNRWIIYYIPTYPLWV
jgi:hypothetical protein